MSAKGCFHLQDYKKSQENLESFKWIHAVFVVANSPSSRKTKICNAYCRTCYKRGPFIHTCLECVYFGCHKHIREHMENQRHVMSMDLTFGQIHCSSCYDYVYDSEIDKITLENKMRAGKFKKRLFQWTSWETTEEERDLLYQRAKKICISPESTIGLRGLVNLGKTCFMNCILQALMHTPVLRDYFLTESHKCSEKPGTCLVCKVSKLFQEFYNGARVPLVLNELLHLIWLQATHLAGDKQQDAHEFFIVTLDILHRHMFNSMPKIIATAENNAECHCIIDQIFIGGMQSDVVCQKCKGVSTTIEPILDFSLDLGPVTIGERQTATLHDCLERFTRAEYLGANALIMCDSCGTNQESTKQVTMKTLPVVVGFHLKRFKHLKNDNDNSLAFSEKITMAISFPEMLDMTPFMSRKNVESLIPPDNRYALFAVINHVGNSMDTGHYVAFVRQSRDNWYKCDDDVITRANLQEVLDSEGYILFYHKQVLEYD